jgi:protein ImuB
MLADLLRRLAGFGVTAQGAVAQSPAAGWGWARFRPAGAPALLACGSGAELAALPVAALRLDKESIETLIGLGLATVGDVAALPRGPLAHRLGEAALTRLDRMFGRAAEPISPQAPAEPWRAQIVFAEPIGRREDFDRAAEHLAGRLCRDLALKGQGARRLELAFYGVDGGVQRLGVGTSRPTHAPLHLLRLFAEKLETIDPGFGVEAIVLSAGETEPVAQTQAVLPDAAVVDAVDLAALIDRLQNRLGTARVLRLIPMESHAPERAERRESCGAPSRKAAEGEARRVGGGRVRGRDHRKAWTPPQKPARPLKLLSLPEPIQAMAPIPDDPPLSFRWRRIVHRVAAADGPERIGPEWWTGAPGRVRDYDRVEDDDGRRFWLYREGLYGAAEPPRWFLHGFFA